MTVSDLQTTMTTILKESATKYGTSSGWKQRTSPLSPEIFVQTLAFGFLENPEATLNELARVAGKLGASVTKQAINERFSSHSVEMMKQVLHEAFQQMVQGEAIELEWMRAFSGIYLNDSTQIAWHDDWVDHWDGGGIAAALKLPVCLEMLRGGLQVELIDARPHDSVTTWPNQDYPAHSVVIEDLGYLDQERINQRAARQVYTVIPCRSTLVLSTESRQPLDLVNWLRRHRHQVVEQRVWWNGSRYRLIAIPLSAETTRRKRKSLRDSARKHGRAPNEKSLALAPWQLVLTTLPEERASSLQIACLMRMRWQIELLFKLWKEQGKLDESRGVKPERVETEFYAKLLGVLLQHWIILTTGWSWIDRSLVQMGQTIREEIRSLCGLWQDLEQFSLWCQMITRLMLKTARIPSHVHHRSTASRLSLVS